MHKNNTAYVIIEINPLSRPAYSNLQSLTCVVKQDSSPYGAVSYELKLTIWRTTDSVKPKGAKVAAREGFAMKPRAQVLAHEPRAGPFTLTV